MKKLLTLLLCAVMSVTVSSCGKKSENNAAVGTIARLSPDTLLSAQMVSTITGANLKMSEEGVVPDGNGYKVTYVADPIGSADTVSVMVEQFSNTLSADQVWEDYKQYYLPDGAMENVSGVGIEEGKGACNITYPYINIYYRGCYVRISAGSGDSEIQKQLLVNLAANAVTTIRNTIPDGAENNTAQGHVIK